MSTSSPLLRSAGPMFEKLKSGTSRNEGESVPDAAELETHVFEVCLGGNG